MNKKGTKKLSGVLAATTVLTSVAGATPVFAQGTNWDALYKTAYEAMQKAEKEKTQESINVARNAIAEVAKNKKLVSMASTLSEKVDAVQQGLFNELYALMYVDGKPKANMTQEEINKAKALVVSFATCPSNKAYIPTWSSAIDPYQQKNIDKLVEAIKTAETTKKAEDIKAARKLANEFLTVTNADMKKAAEGLDVQLAQVEAPEAVKAVEAIKVNELKLENQKEVQAQLDNAKKLAEKVKDEKVKKELTDKIAKSEKAINDKFVALEKLNVEKATVTHANTIKVELSKAVKAEEQAKTNFVVKRGNINISVSAKWTKDGKSVELVAGNAFVAGDYSILATSGEAIATAKVTVEAQKETSLTIDSSVLNGVEENGTVKVSLKDQYGDEYKLDRDKFTVTAFNKTQGKNVEFENNKFELKHDKYKKDDVILVTILHNKTGLTVQKELKVVDSAYVDTISLGKVELSKEDKNGLTRASKNVKISYEAKDQFGNAVELKAGKDNDDIVVISSDSSVLAEGKVEVKNEDKKNYLEISGFEKSGKVVLTVMSKSSGKTARLELDVKEAPGVISNVKLETSDVTIAAGAKHIIGLEVTDNYGKKLEKEKYEKAFTFTSTNPSVVDSSEVSVKGGKVELTVKDDAVKNSKTTISILNQNKIVATINVTAGEKAVATNIELKDGVKPATTLAVGAKTKVEFVVKDQYGNIMKEDISVKNEKNDESKIYAKATKNVVEVEALKEGSEKLVVTLANGDSKEITFNVVKNVSTIGLQIADIPALCKNGGEEYSEQVKVQNKDGVILPANAIVKVISSDPTKVEVDKDHNTIKAVKNDKLEKDEKVKITVIYNAADKAVTLEKEVTVSAKNLKVQEINVLDKELRDNKIDKDAKKVDTKEVTVDDAKNGIKDLYLISKDNFGKYSKMVESAKKDENKVTILAVKGNDNTEVIKEDAVTLDKDGKLVLDSSKLNCKDTKKDAIVRVIISKDGAVAMVNLNVKGLEVAGAVKPGDVHGVEKINEVKNLIAALPEKEVLKLTDKGAVTAARTAYDNLTADQKKLVADITKLTDAEAKIAELDLAGVSVGVVLGNTVETTKGVKEAKKQDEVKEVAAVKQVVELKVTAKASTDGSINIDGEDVAVLASDADVAAIATKIAAHKFANWDVAIKSGETDTVVFTAKSGAKNVTINTEMTSTGVTVDAPKTTKDGVEFKAGIAEVPAVAEVKEVATTTVTAGAKKDATIKVKVADGTLNKTVAVDVKDGDSITVVAGKIREALGKDAEVIAAYDVTGADDNIILTQKAAGTDVDLAVTLV